MLSESKIRRFLPVFLAAICFAGLLPEAHGQLRVFARVEPNAGAVNSSADIYDPSSATITASAGVMGTRRQEHTASLLLDGTVLIAGGYNGSSLSAAEIYSPT